jgi:anti-anti-sigma factor
MPRPGFIQRPIRSAAAVAHEGNSAVIALTGALDAATCALFTDTLSAVLFPEDCEVVIDLTDVDSIDATGIMALVDARDVRRPHGGSPTLRSPSWFARRVVELCDLAPRMRACV